MAHSSFDEIPGTFIFDSSRSRQGYHLNMFCMSLMEADNRAAFKADEAAYLGRFPLTAAQREAILGRKWNAMLELGGNVYYTAKLAATDGLPVAHMSAAMAGMEPKAYTEMMVAGGRSGASPLAPTLPAKAH
jgi:protocatechuate 4,5-dioxygenase alpha chain